MYFTRVNKISFLANETQIGWGLLVQASKEVFAILSY